MAANSTFTWLLQRRRRGEGLVVEYPAHLGCRLSLRMADDVASLQALWFFFFNPAAPTEIYTLSLHDALPISAHQRRDRGAARAGDVRRRLRVRDRQRG